MAYKYKKNIIICCDTKVTKDDNYTNIEEYKRSIAIKSIIINKDICISFAGTIKIAENAINEVYWDIKKNINTIKNILEKYSKSWETEFLLAHINNEKKTILLSIKEWNTSQDLQFWWLGNIEAYNEYSYIYYQNKDTAIKNFKEYWQVCLINNSFKEVVKSRKFTDVWNFVVTIKNMWKWFQYNLEIEVSTWTTTIQANEWKKTPISFGSVANGWYIENYCVPNEWIGAVWIHFHQSQFWYLFFPEKLWNFDIKIYKNLSYKDFVTQIHTEYDINLVWFGIS